MENTNTSAEVISHDLLKNIFSDFEPAQEAPAAAVEQVQDTPQEQIDKLIAPPEKEEVKVEEPVKVITDCSRRLKNAIADGFIENVSINYNGQESFLEDLEDLTDEGYNEIISAYKAEKDKNLKEKYISTESFDEQTKKLIEIKQAGGSITEIIRENVSAIEQLQQLKNNIDNENVQINIVGKDLEQRGNDIELVREQIKRLIDRGELEEKATAILDNHLSIHNEAIEQKKQGELQRAEQEKEDFKNLRKNLSSTYKEFGIPDNISKVLIDNATKLDKDKVSNVDKLYFESVKDPKLYAEISYFLNDPKGFKKWVSSKETLDTKVGTAKALFTINTNNQKKPKLSSNSLEEYATEIINNHNTN